MHMFSQDSRAFCRGWAVGVVGLAGLGWTALMAADLNLLPNPGFEEGTNQPAGWRCDSPGAQWSATAHEGRHGVSLQGNGRNSSAWQTARLPLTPGGLYRFSFLARRDAETSGGCVVSGTGAVNRDFHCLEAWQPYGFTFAVPQNAASDYVRLGQWEVNGRLYFDEASLRPVQVAHALYQGKGRLGDGENVRRGVYHFSANYGGQAANYHRPLLANRCGFNSDRWTFGSGSEVIYRHDLPDAVQKSAWVRLNVNYYVGGALKVEASRDGVEWLAVGAFDANRRAGTNELPASLFPATNVLVRLSGTGANANFQVDGYDYEAPLNGQPLEATGHSDFFEVLQDSRQVAVILDGIQGNGEEQISRSLGFWVTNLSGQTRLVTLALTVDGKRQPTTADVKLDRSSAVATRVEANCRLDSPGRHVVVASVLDLAGGVLFSGCTEVTVPLLADPRAGYWAGGTDDLQLWWCESAWKIGRSKQWPAPPADGKRVPISLAAAKGEAEPVQLILNPRKAGLQLAAIRVGPLTDAQGRAGAVTARVDRVEYVQVTHPTDGTCVAGWYPDPLPSLQTPLFLSKELNCPLWITFHVAREAKAGDYFGQIEIETSTGPMAVPLQVHVYDFALPRETHLRSGLGLGTGDLNRYHHLKTREDRQAVYDKYLMNFVEHRISPYSFFDYAGIEVRFTGEGSNKQAKVDFTKFDQAAARWLDQERFNAFSLPLHGMGGGTFQSRVLGSLEGFKEGTPEHARLFKNYLSQVEQHLRGRGWLDKAYAYWFDEPDQKDFEFVAEGMKRIKAASPGLKRLLTKQPAPLLEGNVDLWCALTPEWTPEKVRARRAANEEVWWYICCGPTAPYITEFIDHPGTELRLWPWQSWQYGVQGILIWTTTYWTSSAAFPAANPQDPWQDPMSYVSGYDFKEGHIGYWGNGDGRFVYPPQQALKAGQPCLEGPVNSVRWENLRDGMEDYEYFWLLEQALGRAQARGVGADLLAEARALLKVPSAVSADTTHFTTDPRLLASHRDRVARMIERLQ